MNNVKFQQLNSILKKYVNNDALDMDLLHLVGNLAEKYVEVDFDYFNMNNPIINYKHQYKNNIGGIDSYKIALDFFRDIDERYAYNLEGIIKNGILDMCDKDDIYCEDYSAKYGYENDNLYINIPLEYNIKDAFKIVHESFHNFNLQNFDERNPDFGLLFTEVISILSEFLLEENLMNKGYHNEEFYYIKLERMINTYGLAVITMLELFVIDIYKENNKIDEEIYFENFTKLSPTVQKLFKMYGEKILNDIILNESLGLFVFSRYVVGVLFASFIYKKSLDDEFRTGDLYFLNENINKISLSDFFDFFKFKTAYKDGHLNFEQNVYEQLINSYQIEVNKMRNNINRISNIKTYNQVNRL